MVNVFDVFCIEDLLRPRSRNAELAMFSVLKRAVHMRGAMESIMLLLLIAALVGELITLTVLWPYGALVAFIGAPFGASALTLIVALLMCRVECKSEDTIKPQRSRHASG